MVETIEEYRRIDETNQHIWADANFPSTQKEIKNSFEKPCTGEEINKELYHARVVVVSEKGNNPIIDVTPGDKLHKLERGIYKQIEDAFETIGDGTGEEIKTDIYNEKGFHQLVVVDKDPEGQQQLLAGYRYYPRWNAWDKEDMHIDTPMTHYFDFGTNFLTNTFNRIIELGTARSNSHLAMKEKIFHFAGAWTGLGNLLTTTQATHFIGKMTIPADYPKLATDFALQYLQLFSDTQAGRLQNPDINLELDDIKPKEEYKYQPDYLGDIVDMSIFTGNYKQDLPRIKVIIQELTNGKYQGFPGMFDIYFGRINKIRYLGSIRKDAVVEAGILVEVGEVESKVKEKYMNAVDDRQERHGTQEGSTITVEDYRKIVHLANERREINTPADKVIPPEIYQNITQQVLSAKFPV